MSASSKPGKVGSAEHLHATFLQLVPKIELHARIYFRGIKCQVKKEDTIQECVALGWKWFARITEQGKDASQFPMTFVTLIARAVKCGRKMCGQEKVKDVMSPVAQRRRGFRVESLPTSTQTSHDRLYATPLGQQAQDAFEERLCDNTVTPPPDQAAFRIDFPAWRGTRSERDRRMVDDLMAGARTKDVSEKFGMSPARVSQLRRDFMEDWARFTGEVA